MPFDRIFADQTELDIAQGNNEFVFGEIYLLADPLRILVPLGTSETKQFYGAGDEIDAQAITVQDAIVTRLHIGGVTTTAAS